MTRPTVLPHRSTSCSLTTPCGPPTDPGGGFPHFLTSIPASIRELIIFENTDKELERLRPVGQLSIVPDPTLAGVHLAMRTSQLESLEHLSVSFAADAIGFFAPALQSSLLVSPRPWSNLRSLALTSRCLRPNAADGDPQLIVRLLHAAATFTLGVDTLRVLEIWNGEGDQYGSLFRYSWDGTSQDPGT